MKKKKIGGRAGRVKRKIVNTKSNTTVNNKKKKIDSKPIKQIVKKK